MPWSPPARTSRTLLLATLPLILMVAGAGAQQPDPAPDSLATLVVRVVHDSAGGLPVPAAIVRSGRVGGQTDERGEVVLRLTPGAHSVIASKIGFRTDSAMVTLTAGVHERMTIALVARAAELEGMVVSATRGERRVEDTPLRVEVIDEEEIAEKVAMTPGDIAMMLNETSGLRVQATNPSLGGANVRIQGLRGRYSLLLADGLPLYGGQAGGLGLLQVPPVDLSRVEIIKGSASALYGSSALGGVINLISRAPGERQETSLLVNQTSRDGTDGVAFLGGPVSERWGYTLLAGAHRQRQNDLDDDGWTDMPGYERAVLRPRLYFQDDAGHSAFLTAGFTAEEREGGTMDGRSLPSGGSYEEALGTRRADIGGLVRWLVSGDGALAGSILNVRGSAMEQRHDHQFGPVKEDDTHRTWFGEASLAIPRAYGARSVTYVVGAAFQQDAYRNADVGGVDYSYDVPSAFVQVDADPESWLSVSTSARLDAHSAFGTFVNPRVSLLFRQPDGGDSPAWTTRLSAGTGAFAPTPFTEETEATGLTPVVLPANGLEGLRAERARSASLDFGVPVRSALGDLELNVTAFGSRVAHALQLRETGDVTAGGASRIALFNAAGPTRSWGAELLMRLVHEFGDGGKHGEEGDEEPLALRITGSYTFLRSTECDPDAPGAVGTAACGRREVPLTPRHAVGMVTSVEQEGRSRLGLELYYTGRQQLEHDPYRDVSRPYIHVGILGERVFDTRAGAARVFVNLENITNVRQTRYDPLLLPTRGAGGRWTTDAWTDLTGFSMNAGVRLGF